MKIDHRFISASSAGLYDRPPTTPSAAEHGPDAHKSRCVRMNVYTYILEVLVYMEEEVLVYMEVQRNKSKIKKY
jgi:hypothetical protein